MTIEYYPFDDQASYEDQWQSMMRYFRGTGIVAAGTEMTTDTANCGVTVGTGLEVLVSEGEAYIRGFYFTNDADYSISITTNSGGGGDRTDYITLRLDRTANTITPHYIEGPGATLTQSDTVWDLWLARVTVTTSDVLTVADRRMMQIPTALLPTCQRRETSSTFTLATGGTTWTSIDLSTTDWQTMPGMIQASDQDRIYINPYGISAGYYQCYARFEYPTSSSNIPGIRILLNGSTSVGLFTLPATSDDFFIETSGLARSTASGDYITVEGRNSTGSTIDIENIYLNVIYLGPYTVG